MVSIPMFQCVYFMFDPYLLSSHTFVEEMVPQTALCTTLLALHSSMKKIFITAGRASLCKCLLFWFFFFLSTGTDLTATEIESVAIDSDI